MSKKSLNNALDAELATEILVPIFPNIHIFFSDRFGLIKSG